MEEARGGSRTREALHLVNIEVALTAAVVTGLTRSLLEEFTHYLSNFGLLIRVCGLSTSKIPVSFPIRMILISLLHCRIRISESNRCNIVQVVPERISILVDIIFLPSRLVLKSWLHCAEN